MTNRRFGRTVCHKGNMVDNLKHRGNTATTSHWVALKDLIDDAAVQPGQRVLFSIQASGITIGLAQYRVDSFAAASGNGVSAQRAASHQPGDTADSGYYRAVPVGERVRIGAAATTAGTETGERGNVKLAASAVAGALGRAAAGDRHLGLLIYSGVYREAVVSEPALAPLVARELGLKGSCTGDRIRPLLAFDVMNGPPAVLMACQVAGRLLLSRAGVAVVAVSEFCETPVPGDPEPNIANTGSALLLERSEDATGFCSFYFDSRPEHLGRYNSYAQTDTSGPPRLGVVSDAHLQDYYREALVASVRAMLQREHLTLDDYAVILPPQFSPQFVTRLAAELEVEHDRLVACGTEDLFTSAAAAGWEAARARTVPAGALGLFLAVGPGIEVACASYRF